MNREVGGRAPAHTYWRYKSLPRLAALLLPLGVVGIAGVALAAVFVVANWRAVGRAEKAPLAFAAPLAAAMISATILRLPRSEALLAATSYAAVISIGTVAMRALVAAGDRSRLLTAYVGGAAVLAVSVLLDAVVVGTPLPSGLYLDPSLHNWAGTTLAFAVPVAIHLLSTRPASRVLSAIALAAILAGLVVSLSWSGVVGALAGSLVYAAHVLEPRRRVALVAIVVVVVALLLSLWSTGIPRSLRVRQYSLATLQHVLSERAAILRAGYSLAMEHPALGWGYSSWLPRPHELKPASGATGETRVREIDAPSNLISGSEDFGSASWTRLGARVARDRAQSPVGSVTADLVTSDGKAGARIFQRVRLSRDDPVSPVTFAVWVRRVSGGGNVALAIRDRAGGVDGVGALGAGPIGEPVGERAVRFSVGEEWQHVYVTAELDAHPPTDVLVAVYLDGFYSGEDGSAELLLWGAQFTRGTTPGAYQRTAAPHEIASLDQISHFHNIFVQTFVDAGILGLASLLLFLVSHYIAMSMAPSFTAVSRGAFAVLLVTQFFDLAILQASIYLYASLALSLSQVAEAGNRGDGR